RRPGLGGSQSEGDRRHLRQAGRSCDGARRRISRTPLDRPRREPLRRHGRRVRDPSGPECERQLGQGGAARARPHRARSDAWRADAPRRDERRSRDRHRPSAQHARSPRHARTLDRTLSMTGPASGAHRGLITLCVMLATIMQALDTTIANVALPYMQGSLSAGIDQINWVLTSYIVAAAIMTPPTGWLAARFGRKRLFLVTVAGFTAASVLCGVAGSLEEMVIFRLLQGVFGAPLVPLSQSVLLDSYPR